MLRTLTLVLLVANNVLSDNILFTNLSSYETTVIREEFSDSFTDEPSSIHFDAFGQSWIIELRTKENDLLDPLYNSYLIDGNGVHHPGDLAHTDLFNGYVRGYPEQRTQLTRLEKGLWMGTVAAPDDIFYIEPALWHRPLLFSSNPREVIVYPASAVQQHPTQLSQSLSHGSSLASTFSSIFRRRRSLQSIAKNRCPLKIVADHFFFEKIGHGSQALATRYIAGLVDRVNSIFSATDWGLNEDGVHLVNMGFSIKKIVVHEKPNNTFNHYNTNHSYFLQHNQQVPWDVANLHQKFAKMEGSSEFCLVLLFSARPLDGTVKGEAYMGGETGVGGVCGDPALGEVQYNTLYATFVDSSRLMVTREVDLIVAHELGHAWGATHDPIDDERCSPSYAEGGLFIMHLYTLSGYDFNNYRFSPCSRELVQRVLSRRAWRCFESEQASRCGNGVLEEGEECDSAPSSSPCCTRECRFRGSAKCSPLNEPCCSPSCQFLPAGHVCAEASTAHCVAESVCTGQSGFCPDAWPAPDGRECLDGGECVNGTCTPFCQSRGRAKLPCICSDPFLACRRCCRSPVSQVCEIEDGAVNLSDGTPCLLGYCRNAECRSEKGNDFIVHYFDVLRQVDRATVWPFLKTNIVGITVTCSLLMWIPICLLVSARDRSLRRPLPALSIRRPQLDRSIIYTPNVSYNIR